MSAVIDAFHEYGIDVTDAEVADAVRAALDGLDSPRSVVLPATEAAIYDQAGMGEDRSAWRRQVAARAARYAVLVQQSLPLAEAADRLGVSRSRLQQRVSTRSVWAIRDPTGRWRLPLIQFHHDRLLPGWAVISQALPEGATPLEVLGLLTTPQPELRVDGQPATIIDWLSTGGDPGPAATIAAAPATAA